MEMGAMFRFKRDEIDRHVLDQIQLELVLKQRSGEKFGFGDGQYVCLSKQVGDWIEVPRQYGVGELLDSKNYIDKTDNGHSAKFTFKGILREEQKPLIADFMSKIGRDKAKYGGILSAPCGTGKTVSALKILSELGRTAIVLVHTGFLMKQWRESILKFTDLDSGDIGCIQQDVCDWRGKKIVIAMVESLCAREYDPAMYKYFGVSCADECHRHGAAEWNRVIPMFPARIRIGLSATPRRADGLWDVIRWHVGEVLTKGVGGNKAMVFCVPTGIGIPSHLYQWRSKINLSRLVNLLVGIQQRNELIVRELIKAVQSGRKVLVLSDRLAHLDDLRRMFCHGWGIKNPVRIGYYIGGMKDGQIEHSRTCTLLFGTMQYAKEGLDHPEIDTLMLVTPKSDVEQACGRILREVEGKKTPFVIDFVDELVGPCLGFSRSRRRHYQRLGFDVADIRG